MSLLEISDCFNVLVDKPLKAMGAALQYVGAEAGHFISFKTR